jgi:serine O-acetyltransferase
MGAALVRSIYAYQHYKARGDIVAKIMRRYSRLRHLFWSVITASDINPNVTVGRGLMLPHPNGVIVHGESVIGDDCFINQQVTIGQLAEPHAPVIGSGVYIGAGAKVLGKIVIGDRARIGANAVVLCDVPADWTAVGVPARLISPDSKKRPAADP